MSDTRERQALGSITLFVIAVHLALIVWAYLGFEKVAPPQKSVKLIAKTIQLEPRPNNRAIPKNAPIVETESFDDVILQPTEEIAMREEPVQPLPRLDKSEVKATPQKEIEIPKKKSPLPPPKPKPKETPKPKPEVAKKPPPPPKPKVTTEPKETPKPKPVTEPSKPIPKPDPKKRALLNEAQSRIASINFDSNKPAKKGELKVPEYHPQATLTHEEGLSSGEISYQDELASHLQLHLTLPEMGKVQLKLTLNKSGKFVKLTINNSPSGLNKQYIEKKLPNLTLPGFGEQFGGAAEYTFSITLTSDL